MKTKFVYNNFHFFTSELLFTFVSKQVLKHSLSYGNEFDLKDNEHARKSHFNTITFN